MNHKKEMNMIQWILAIALAVAISPLGTFIGVVSLGLSFVGAVWFMLAQLAVYALVFAVSNGGDPE